MDQAVYRRMRAAKAIADDPRCDPGTREAAINRYDAMIAKYGDPFAKPSKPPPSGGYANRENFGTGFATGGPFNPFGEDGPRDHWNCRSTVHPSAEEAAAAREAREKEKWNPEREHWKGDHPNFKRKTRERERMEEEMRRQKEGPRPSDAADAFAYGVHGSRNPDRESKQFRESWRQADEGVAGTRAEYVFVDDPARPGTQKAEPVDSGWANGYDYREAADRVYGRHAPGDRARFEADFLAMVAKMARARMDSNIAGTLERGRKCGRALIWLRDYLGCDVDIVAGEPYNIGKGGTKIGGPFSQQGVINFAHLQGWNGK